MSARASRRQQLRNIRSWTIYYLGKDGRRRANIRTRADAHAKAKALTEREDVVWVTVYPPIPRVGTGFPPTYKWSRRRGWRTEA